MIRLLLVAPFLVFAGVALSTPESVLQIHGDIELYHRVSLAVLQGAVPYRDVALEYPPLALVPMLVPRLLLPDPALDVPTYRLVLALWNGALASITAWLLLGLSRRIRPNTDAVPVLAAYLVLVTIGTSVLPWRFDLFPVSLTAGAVLLLLYARPTTAGVLLGLAVSAKLYPLVVLPVLVLWLLSSADRRGAARLTVAAAVTVMLVVVPFLLADPFAATLPLRYQLGRPLEIASVAAGIVELLAQAGLTTVSWVNVFSAIHIESPLSPLFLQAGLLLTATTFGLVYLTIRERFTRSPRPLEPRVLVDAIVLVLALLLVTDKIYSAQFTWWLLPFAALLRPTRLAMGAVVAALTSVIYPPLFNDLTAQQPFPVAVLNVRNGMLVVLVVALWLDVRPHLGRPSFAIRLGVVTNALAFLLVALLVTRTLWLSPQSSQLRCPGSVPPPARVLASDVPIERGDCRGP